MTDAYQAISRHYEGCLRKFGDSHRGGDWPNDADAATRYQVMLALIKQSATEQPRFAFGCGASHLYQTIPGHHVVRNDDDLYEYATYVSWEHS